MAEVLFNTSKLTWLPGSPSVPTCYPVLLDGILCPPTLNFSSPGAGLLFPQLAFLIYSNHFGYLTFPVSSHLPFLPSWPPGLPLSPPPSHGPEFTVCSLLTLLDVPASFSSTLPRNSHVLFFFFFFSFQSWQRRRGRAGISLMAGQKAKGMQKDISPPS